MSSDERSRWLKYTRKPNGSHRSGRKRFEISKNDHSPYFLNLIEEPANSFKSRKLELPKIIKISPENTKFSKQKKEQEVQVNSNQMYDLEQRLKQRETEVRILKNLYAEADNKLKRISSGVLIGSASKTPGPDRKSEFSNDSGFNMANQSVNGLKRNASGHNNRIGNNLESGIYSPFSQPKYPKSRPKIIFTNPITGVVPF